MAKFRFRLSMLVADGLAAQANAADWTLPREALAAYGWTGFSVGIDGLVRANAAAGP